MAYIDLTTLDPNPIKRQLQRKRLLDAIKIVPLSLAPGVIVDFGAGGGEFTKLAAKYFDQATIFCYEPEPSLREEARQFLDGTANVVLVTRIDELPIGNCDLVFCMEVLEHLPPAETEQALSAINQLLKPDGMGIIGVPIEVFIPGLVKGLFRMTRRYGQFDARLSSILRAATGGAFEQRPKIEITPGKFYYPMHTGFDYRQLAHHLAEKFDCVEEACSPFKSLGAWANSEIYFLVKNKSKNSKNNLQ